MEYKCEGCNYKTIIKFNYNRHIISNKHEKKMRSIPHLDTNKTRNNHICEKCKKQLKSKQSLEKHIPICRGTTYILECGICNKVFNSICTRIRHEKKCKPKIIEDKNVANIIINSNNNNITYIITNNINNYGSEKYDYISNEKLEEISLNSRCRELIDLIYFNKEHPENQNIQLHSNKSQLYKVFLDDCWKTLKKFETVHDEIITKATNIMMKVYEETKVEFDLLEHNQKFGSLLKSKSVTKKNLENHIYCNIASKNL
jgi:hypothetical protein